MMVKRKLRNSLLANELSKNEPEDDEDRLDSVKRRTSCGSDSVEEHNSCGDVAINQREGTMTSGRFNILSSMVGGGSLSLPLAFYQAGNGFLAPFLLVFIATLIEFSIYFLVQAGNRTTRGDGLNNSKGSLAYESVASAALGTTAGHVSTVLVCTNCFFCIAGYGVLLRDMLLPISDYLFPNNDSDTDGGPTFAHNAIMVFVIFIVTPLCTLKNLTALQHIGAASMLSIFTVFCCITYRSVECNFSSQYENTRHMHWRDYVSFFPSGDGSTSISSTLHQLANSLPILITVFMCHFNVLPVHNELRDPSPKRVNRLFASSIWSATMFYLLMGFVGSMYGNCTINGRVEGNVLLSFPEDDILLMVGRGCLSLTIAFALPVFVVPTRDMFLRGLDSFCKDRREGRGADAVDSSAHLQSHCNCSDEYEHPDGDVVSLEDGSKNDLTQPLLIENDGEGMIAASGQEGESNGNTRRIIASIGILWAAAAIACCVKSIDTVWDVLGGSFQIIMGFTIPSVSYLSLTKPSEGASEIDSDNEDICDGSSMKYVLYRTIAWILLIGFIPVMFICTGNSIYNIVTSS